MSGRRKPSRWAEKAADRIDWWNNLDFKAIGLLAPRHFWRWKPWQKFLFALVMTPAVILLLMVLSGCARPAGQAQGSQWMIEFSAALAEAPICRQLGYTVDDAALGMAREALFNTAVAEGIDEATATRTLEAALSRRRAERQKRLSAVENARSPATLRAPAQIFWSREAETCATLAAGEVTGTDVVAPAGYDRELAVAAKVAQTAVARRIIGGVAPSSPPPPA